MKTSITLMAMVFSFFIFFKNISIIYGQKNFPIVSVWRDQNDPSHPLGVDKISTEYKGAYDKAQPQRV